MRRQTLLTVKAAQDPRWSKVWAALGDAEDTDLEAEAAAREIIETTGAVDYALDVSKRLHDSALAAFRSEVLPAELTAALVTIVDKLAERTR